MRHIFFAEDDLSLINGLYFFVFWPELKHFVNKSVL